VPSTVAGSRKGNIWRGAQDLWLEVFILFNLVCLTGDIVLAHSENAFRAWAEYIPVWFSPAAAVALAFCLFARVRLGWRTVWADVGSLIAWISIAVGAAGVIFHLESRFFYERTLKSLTYAAPFVAPLAYMGLGCLLLMNRMVDHRKKEWAQWVLFMALGGFAGNFVLSLTDHAQNGFFHWTEWIPVASSAFAVGFLLTLLFAKAGPRFLWLCAGVLIIQMFVGGLGFVLHGLADVHGPSPSSWENVIHGAPPFAPLLLPNLAILGLLGMLAMEEHVGVE